MIVVMFRSKLTAAAGDEYQAMNDRLDERVRGMPGFVAVKSFQADDGERLTVVWWQDEETLEAWRDDPPHRAAQQTGRDRWYEYYEMEVAQGHPHQQLRAPRGRGGASLMPPACSRQGTGRVRKRTP